MPLFSLGERRVELVGQGHYVAYDATLVGSISLHADANIWFKVVIRAENDHITINFLQWFLTEQLEEVSSMDNLLKIVRRAGDDLLQADEYLARVGLRTMPEPPAV